MHPEIFKQRAQPAKSKPKQSHPVKIAVSPSGRAADARADLSQRMKLTNTLVLMLIPIAAASDLLASESSSVIETIPVPNHIPCCEDLPTLTSLGLLSQSVVRRSKARCVIGRRVDSGV